MSICKTTEKYFAVLRDEISKGNATVLSCCDGIEIRFNTEAAMIAASALFDLFIESDGAYRAYPWDDGCIIECKYATVLLELSDEYDRMHG